MSLTSFIKIPEVKEKLSEIIKRPDIKLDGKIKAIPLTKNYSLVGTAFDYLLRFVLESNFKAISTKWIAEESIELLSKIKHPEKDVINTLLKICKKRYKEYLKDKKVDDFLVESCIILAKIDLIYRCAIFEEHMGYVDDKDKKDLLNLYNFIDLNNFKPNSICLLNPTFNQASHLVGGADADLVIDDTIIDIKTTKNLSLTKDYLNQLVGYYFLYKIGGFSGLKEKININFVGIYFSRYGLLCKIPIKDLINIDDNKNVKWFEERAKQEGYNYNLTIEEKKEVLKDD
jgi:hypothetical protein